jgi:hypothetical protein
MALSGSVTSGGGGSISADSALSGSVSLRDLSLDFFDSLRDEVLSGVFPDFVLGPNRTASLSGALLSEETGSAFAATEDDRALSADFVLDLALAMA